MSRFAQIIGVGSYLPERVLSNSDLESMVDTTDDWIVSRTGISERHIIAEDEATSDLAVRAAARAMDSACITADEVDLLVVATTNPDYLFPSAACVTQAKLGLTCPAYDVSAACSGFVFALHSGVCAIESGRAETVIVVGAEAFSRFVDFTDRTTCVLFGDGAGAVVLRAGDEPGVEAIVLGSDGTGEDMLKIPAGGSARPVDAEALDERLNFVTMRGSDVFKFAVRVIPQATIEALTASGHELDEVRWFVPHQANKRIIDTVGERLGVEESRIYNRIGSVGNTSSASIPLALDDLYTSGRLSPGDLLVLTGFGAGLTWGSATVRWTMKQTEQGAEATA